MSVRCGRARAREKNHKDELLLTILNGFRRTSHNTPPIILLFWGRLQLWAITRQLSIDLSTKDRNDDR